MTKTRRISLLILSVLLSAVTVVSGFTVYRELSLQQKEKEDFAALAKLVQITSPKPQQFDEKQSPSDDKPEPVRSLAPLFAQNSDCIGWLSIPDTQLPPMREISLLRWWTMKRRSNAFTGTRNGNASAFIPKTAG